MNSPRVDRWCACIRWDRRNCCTRRADRRRHWGGGGQKLVQSRVKPRDRRGVWAHRILGGRKSAGSRITPLEFVLHELKSLLNSLTDQLIRKYSTRSRAKASLLSNDDFGATSESVRVIGETQDRESQYCSGYDLLHDGFFPKKTCCIEYHFELGARHRLSAATLANLNPCGIVDSRYLVDICDNRGVSVFQIYEFSMRASLELTK